MKRLLTLCIILLLVLTVLPFSVSASEDEPLVIDNAHLLKTKEIEALQAAAEAVSESRGIKVVILTMQFTESDGCETAADNYYDKHFALKGEPDGILLLYSVGDGELYISTAGTMIEIADEDIVDEILDEIEDDVRNGNYNTAFENYVKKVDSECETFPARKEARLKQEAAARKKRLIKSLIIAPVVGLFIALIPVQIQKSKLTTIRANDNADAYFRDDSQRLTESRDVFLYTNTTTRIIQTEKRGIGSGSSGGGHTHVSSSGIIHGGHGRKL